MIAIKLSRPLGRKLDMRMASPDFAKVTSGELSTLIEELGPPRHDVHVKRYGVPSSERARVRERVKECKHTLDTSSREELELIL
jgi:hypothetical protein